MRGPHLPLIGRRAHSKLLSRFRRWCVRGVGASRVWAAMADPPDVVFSGGIKESVRIGTDTEETERIQPGRDLLSGTADSSTTLHTTLPKHPLLLSR